MPSKVTHPEGMCISPVDDSYILMYRLLDTFPLRRIIKDVMKHQSGKEEKRKKRLTSDQTGSQESDQADVLIDDEIDPADFFDPEEFGFRRKRESSNP